ncbi:MAG: hypothetical protein U0269_27240 [Polyangiales bacterium]
MNTSIATRCLVSLSLTLAACGGSTANSQGGGDTSSGGASQSYTIRMHRPARVGLRTRQTHVGSSRELRVVRANGAEQPRSEQQTHVEFDAVAEVLAVNSVSKPTRVRYTVERFTSSDGEQSSAVLAAGTTIEVAFAASSEESVISVAGSPASEAIRKALNDAINLTVSDENEDAVFGTRTPRAVGASWPANIEPLRRQMEQGPLEVPADGTQATVTLAGVVNREPGNPLLDVRGNVEINNARLRSMPAGFTSMTITMQMRMRSLFSSTDLEALPSETESSMDTRAHGSGTVQGASIELDIESHSERRATYVVVQ